MTQKNEEIKQIEKEVPVILEHVKKMKILTDGDIIPVAEVMREIKKKGKFIEDFMNPLISSAHKTHKMALERKNIPMKILKDAQNECKRKIGEYHLLQKEKSEREQEELELMQLKNEAAGTDDMDFLSPMLQVRKPETKFKDATGKSMLTITDDFKIEITEFYIFINAIIDGKLPKTAVKIQENEIKKHIKAMDLTKWECEKLGIRKVADVKTTVRG
jgi:hypothetical protein